MIRRKRILEYISIEPLKFVDPIPIVRPRQGPTTHRFSDFQHLDEENKREDRTLRFNVGSPQECRDEKTTG